MDRFTGSNDEPVRCDACGLEISEQELYERFGDSEEPYPAELKHLECPRPALREPVPAKDTYELRVRTEGAERAWLVEQELEYLRHAVDNALADAGYFDVVRINVVRERDGGTYPDVDGAYLAPPLREALNGAIAHFLTAVSDHQLVHSETEVRVDNEADAAAHHVVAESTAGVWLQLEARAGEGLYQVVAHVDSGGGITLSLLHSLGVGAPPTFYLSAQAYALLVQEYEYARHRAHVQGWG